MSMHTSTPAPFEPCSIYRCEQKDDCCRNTDGCKSNLCNATLLNYLYIYTIIHTITYLHRFTYTYKLFIHRFIYIHNYLFIYTIYVLYTCHILCLYNSIYTRVKERSSLQSYLKWQCAIPEEEEEEEVRGVRVRGPPPRRKIECCA